MQRARTHPGPRIHHYYMERRRGEELRTGAAPMAMRQTRLEWSTDGLKVRPPKKLMDLPQELIDRIYEEYFTLPGGYRINPKSGMCVAASDQCKIDLSLCYVSKRIREQTEGLALKYNTIHAYPAEADVRFWEDPHKYGVSMDLRVRLEERVLMASRQIITPDLFKEITRDFPQYRAAMAQAIANQDLLDMFRGRKDDAMSTRRDFVVKALDVLQHEPSFAREVKLSRTWDVLRTKRSFGYMSRLKTLPLWVVPNHSYHDDIFRHLDVNDVVALENSRESARVKHFSAATLAIRAIETLPRKTLKQIRNIQVNETRASASFPETHAQGFIRFLRVNPKLRIHRKVSIDQVIFPTMGYVARRDYRGPTLDADGNASGMRNIDSRDEPSLTTSAIWPWIREVWALQNSCMSPSQYTFEFVDGDVDALGRSKLFDYMQQDIAWQCARRAALHRDISNDISRDQSGHTPYLWPHYDMLQFALQDMVSGSSPIKCTFKLRPVADAESLMRWDGRWWEEQWLAHVNKSPKWSPGTMTGGWTLYRRNGNMQGPVPRRMRGHDGPRRRPARPLQMEPRAPVVTVDPEPQRLARVRTADQVMSIVRAVQPHHAQSMMDVIMDVEREDHLD